MSTTYLIIILTALTTLFYLLWRRASRLAKAHAFAKKSLSSKYGKMTEQFMPFLDHYPFDSSGFRFMGTPIDGVQFNEDGIVFIEFKTASSKLSPRQTQIRSQVKEGKVKFEEIRI